MYAFRMVPSIFFYLDLVRYMVMFIDRLLLAVQIKS